MVRSRRRPRSRKRSRRRSCPRKRSRKRSRSVKRSRRSRRRMRSARRAIDWKTPYVLGPLAGLGGAVLGGVAGYSTGFGAGNRLNDNIAELRAERNRLNDNIAELKAEIEDWKGNYLGNAGGQLGRMLDQKDLEYEEEFQKRFDNPPLLELEEYFQKRLDNLPLFPS